MYARDNIVVGIISFTGEKENSVIVQNIEKSFIKALIDSHLFSIVERDNLEAVETKQGIYFADIIGQPAKLSEAGKLLNMQFLFSGAVSNLNERLYLTVKMISVETSEIVISKRTKGFYPESRAPLIQDLVLEITLETGIRENPPSILTPRIIGVDFENNLLKGDIGTEFIDLQYNSIVSGRLLFELFNGEEKVSILEVVDVSPNFFLAEPISTVIPKDLIDNENYTLSGIGRRMPFSILVGGGLMVGNYPYPTGTVGLNYTSPWCIGLSAYLTYIGFIDVQEVGVSIYTTYTFGLRSPLSLRLGAGIDFMDTSTFFSKEDLDSVQPPYPSTLIQLIIGDIWNTSFATTLRYKLYLDSISGNPIGNFFKSTSIDLSVVFHPGFYNK